MHFYIETSALLNILFSEANSKKFKHAIDAASTVVTSALTLLEAKRVLLRAQLQSQITESDSHILYGVLEQYKSFWQILSITEEIEQRVARRFPIEPLRTLDAIHLATALEFKRVYPDLVVLSSDQRIIENLQPLGLQ